MKVALATRSTRLAVILLEWPLQARPRRPRQRHQQRRWHQRPPPPGRPSRLPRPFRRSVRRRGRGAVVPTSATSEDVAVIEVMVKPGDAVKVEQSLITGRERQGVDGDPVVARRRGQGRPSRSATRCRGQRRRAVEVGAAARGATAPPRWARRRRPCARRRWRVPSPAPVGERRTAPGALPPARSRPRPPARTRPEHPQVRLRTGVPLAEVKGSPKGRITQVDVQAFVKA